MKIINNDKIRMNNKIESVVNPVSEKIHNAINAVKTSMIGY